VKERPILFNGPMVQRVLDGSKTQTRRLVNERHLSQIDQQLLPSRAHWSRPMPYGQAGDRLWVRETFNGPLWPDNDPFPEDGYQPKFCEYRADGGPAPWYCDADDNIHEGWKPSIHMPRWASRITLEVAGVRVQRLKEVSEEDAKAEGAPWVACGSPQEGSHIAGFAHLWESIAGHGSWDANPWVWVVEFKRLAPD
jgi:hypothetical protein